METNVAVVPWKWNIPRLPHEVKIMQYSCRNEDANLLLTILLLLHLQRQKHPPSILHLPIECISRWIEYQQLVWQLYSTDIRKTMKSNISFDIRDLSVIGIH